MALVKLKLVTFFIYPIGLRAMNEPVLKTLNPLEELEQEEEEEEVNPNPDPVNEPLSPSLKPKPKLLEKSILPKTLSINSIESIYDEIKTADELGTPPPISDISEPIIKKMDFVLPNNNTPKSALASLGNSFSAKTHIENPMDKTIEEHFDRNGLTSVKDWWLNQVNCHSSDEED